MKPVVEFEGVSKVFRRGKTHESLGALLAVAGARLVGRRSAPPANVFAALDDVSFAVQPGETLGIIGPNGAGKSTALKLLAGILRADVGKIAVRGRLAALIEVSAGLHGELTGRENIYLNGAILGMSRREIGARFDDIVAFAGLDRFIDTPVKRYSTGMQARLGFATAAHVSPDVLLVDEVLSVGDVAFRHRCEERMAQLVDDGVALVFVTHNLEQMRSICSQTLVLDHGRTLFTGSPTDAVHHYLQAVMYRTGEFTTMDQPREQQAVAHAIDLRFLDQHGQAVRCVNASSPMQIEMTFQLDEPVARLTVETALRRAGYEQIVSLNSRQQGVTFAARPGRNTATIDLPTLPLASGAYFAMVRVWDADRARLLGETPYRFTLQVDDAGATTGLVALPHAWSDLRNDATALPAPALAKAT